jgi:hypothetical protein
MPNPTKKLQMTLPLILLSVISPFAAQPSYGQDIWLDPRAGPGGAPDYFDLFTPGAPWTRAASRTKAFEVSIQVLTMASDADLKKIFDGLRERHVALALGMLPLTGGPENAKCGHNVEGYSSALQTLAVAQRVKKLGGEPQFYDMDEPLYFGHLYAGQNACHSSIQDIAADTAAKVKQVKGIFPSVEIGDSEPIEHLYRDRLGDLKDWLDAFQMATGSPLSFLRLDMNWSDDWRNPVIAVSQLLAQKGVPLQIVYNGSGNDRSDQEWISHALANARAFESVVKPAGVAIETWNSFPKRVLPETDPMTLTGLLDQYVSLKGSQ